MAKNEVHNLRPFVWLIEAQLDDTQVIRVAGHDRQIVWDLKTWDPFPVSIGVQERDIESSLPEVEVTVGNIDGVIAGYLESGKILDQKVTVRLVHAETLSGAVHEGVYRAREATVTIQTATITCGMYRVLEAPFPAQRYSRGRCRFLSQYGGAGCLYDRSLPNAISGTDPDFDPASCDGTLNGANGCRVHGSNERANGKPSLHPLNFGGFPGIPRGRARV